MFRLSAALLTVLVATPLASQGRNKRPKNQPAAAAAPTPTPAGDSLNNLKFRNLGPSVAGGRVAAVAGVPGDRNVYYVGAGGGGVWKTTDGGEAWGGVFTVSPTAAISA